MKASLMRVGYNYAPGAYCVVVTSSSGRVLEKYVAGNSRFDSQGYVNPNNILCAVSPEQLRDWSKQTAEEMAMERGIPVANVSRDDRLRGFDNPTC